MNYDNLIVEINKNIAVITLNHPPANAWNLAMMQDFENAVNVVEDDKDVRVVIITGQGEKCFSAGFDVSDSGNAATTAPLGRKLWRKIDRFPKPVIAAINGFALGGGMELALSCHFRFMVDAPKTTMGLTELNLGIIPGWGGTQRLARIVGKSKALDMIFFSRKVGAKDALKIGLINQISEPGKVVDDAMEFAETLAKRPPIAIRCVLEAISAGEYKGIDHGLDVEADGTHRVTGTQDCIEGFTAFMQKREPVFKGE